MPQGSKVHQAPALRRELITIVQSYHRAVQIESLRTADLFDNPMGLCGFEFVEFASSEPGILEPLFEKLGFSLVVRRDQIRRGTLQVQA